MLGLRGLEHSGESRLSFAPWGWRCWGRHPPQKDCRDTARLEVQGRTLFSPRYQAPGDADACGSAVADDVMK